jgi:hypothetical protein
MANPWRLAKSLERLRSQVNDAWPDRAKTSDGTVGDAAHSSRSSDHNPWVKDGSMGVVTALDITHDPINGPDAGELADALKASRDPRIKYIISNRRIWNPAVSKDWRPYTGSNPHSRHVHISVKPEKKSYDAVTPWVLGNMKPASLAEVGDEETSVVSVEGSPAARVEEIKESASHDAETRGSWLSRKWKSLTGWFSGISGVGFLGYLTDPWVIVAIGGVVLLIVVLFILFMGPREVRAWIRKQVS